MTIEPVKNGAPLGRVLWVEFPDGHKLSLDVNPRQTMRPSSPSDPQQQNATTVRQNVQNEKMMPKFRACWRASRFQRPFSSR